MNHVAPAIDQPQFAWRARRMSPAARSLTMRDTESVRRIEDEIEISRRLSASGRLTRGVAHEVKNPLQTILMGLDYLVPNCPVGNENMAMVLSDMREAVTRSKRV